MEKEEFFEESFSECDAAAIESTGVRCGDASACGIDEEENSSVKIETCDDFNGKGRKVH